MKKKNWIISLLLGISVAFGAFALSSCDNFGTSSSSSIEQPSMEGILYEISEDGTYATVTKYEGVATEVFIANTYNGVPVTFIGESAFSGCDSLTSVVIPDSVTSIGYEAFRDCTNLTSVVIPDSVTSIGYMAFWNCTNLTNVVIPDSVTSIGLQAFYACTSLTSVVIGDSVTSIGDLAFGACYSLTSITVTANNTAYQSIDGNLYSKDGKTLIQYAIGKTDTSFIIPDSVTSIGERAFYNCTSLTSVYYQGTASDWAEIKIGSYIFYNTNATVYYYSASTPTESGKYWHYDENGNIVIW